MGILAVRTDREIIKTAKREKKIEKPNEKLSPSKLKERQQEEFKQGLKEAILISRGEMEGIPLSELWNE